MRRLDAHNAFSIRVIGAPVFAVVLPLFVAKAFTMPYNMMLMWHRSYGSGSTMFRIDLVLVMKKIGGRVREEVHDSSMIRGGISEVIIEGVFMLVEVVIMAMAMAMAMVMAMALLFEGGGGGAACLPACLNSVRMA